MSYAVKEIFLTLQGEGGAGGPAGGVLPLRRLQPLDRPRAGPRQRGLHFCDTDFVGIDGPGGGRFADAAGAGRRDRGGLAGPAEHRFVVLTGGEPLLQVDAPLIDALHARGFEIAIETNGTLDAPAGIDWICVSPKAGRRSCCSAATS